MRYQCVMRTAAAVAQSIEPRSILYGFAHFMSKKSQLVCPAIAVKNQQALCVYYWLSNVPSDTAWRKTTGYGANRRQQGEKYCTRYYNDTFKISGLVESVFITLLQI